MYRLISATPSPYARKVRIQLAEKGIPFELVTEVPWNADSRTSDHNPLEKLPVLIREDGEAIYESRYINEWVETMHPEPPLMPTDRDSLLRAKKFEVLSDGICDAFVLVFIERLREPARQSPDWIARQLRKTEGGLRDVSRLLGTAEYCVGGAFSIADIAVGSLLGWMRVRMTDHPWASLYPNLSALSERLEARPSFAASVPYAQVIRDKVA